VDTTASFSVAGTYVLRLTADDSAQTASDELTVTVDPAPSLTIAEARVSAGSDDAEEELNGIVSLSSSDLEFVFDSADQQMVGMRFDGLQVPQGATIVNAYIQFQVDETSNGVAAVTIQGESTDNALTFTSADFNISNRLLLTSTAAVVAWSPAPWPNTGAAGADQQTPDISSIIQEIVNRTGWASGNAVAIIVTGTAGDHTAESFNGDSAAAPLLRVEYSTGTGTNQAPTVDAGPDQSISLPNTANLSAATVVDDGLPIPPGVVTTTWSQVSGPGTTTFGNANEVDTTASFSVEGTYVLRLSADDGALSATPDELTVTVNPQGTLTTTEVRISAGTDDAEERASGSISLKSSDLEFAFDGGGDQTVGMRFSGVQVPPGAVIVNAYIQFQADETNTAVTSLTIQGEAADNALTFTQANSSISDRLLITGTIATVGWDPAPWTVVGAAGPDQQTPDISSIIQEIVGRPGWANGNALAIIVTGTGERTAESFNGDAAAAPLLRIEYQ
jgi:hypothetical protein